MNFIKSTFNSVTDAVRENLQKNQMEKVVHHIKDGLQSHDNLEKLIDQF